LIVTAVPPKWLPEFGDTAVTTGPYVNWSVEMSRLVPPGPVTVTSTVDFVAAIGAVAVIDVFELTVKFVAVAPPKSTDVAPLNPLPVIVIELPGTPTLGESEVIAGTG
jgi:hypothetical protein